MPLRGKLKKLKRNLLQSRKSNERLQSMKEPCWRKIRQGFSFLSEKEF